MLLLVVVPGYVLSRAESEALVPEVAPQLGEPPTVVRNETTITSSRAATNRMIHQHIRETARRHGVSEALVAAIIAVESEYNPRAVSRRGAQGLMQLMPATASSLSVDDPFDPRENIEAGVRHLRRLLDRFDHNLPLVLAAYNAGEQAVLRYRGVPPYRETRQYISRVLRRVERAQPGSVRLRNGSARMAPRSGLRAELDSPPSLLIIPVVYRPAPDRAGKPSP
jgi:hypothetical protein